MLYSRSVIILNGPRLGAVNSVHYREPIQVGKLLDSLRPIRQVEFSILASVRPSDQKLGFHGQLQTYPSYHTGIGFNSYLLRDGTSSNLKKLRKIPESTLRFKLLESENCSEHCCLWEYFYSCLVRCVLGYSSFAKCCLALAKQIKLLFWIWDWCALDHTTKV